MEPWITPEVIGALEVEATLTTTEKVLFEDSRWQFKSAFRPRLRAVTFSSGYNLKIIFSKIKWVSVIQNRSSIIVSVYLLCYNINKTPDSRL